jgi:hypothetical protein
MLGIALRGVTRWRGLSLALYDTDGPVVLQDSIFNVFDRVAPGLAQGAMQLVCSQVGLFGEIFVELAVMDDH